MFFDPTYFVIVGPAILLALWAQFRVRSAFSAAAEIGNRRQLSGAQAARAILDANGLSHVEVEPSQGGSLSDHYDPRSEVVRLSPEVFEGRSLAAVGIAAHECGHAIQKQQRYAALAMRNGLVPLAATGGKLSGLLIMLGFVLMYAARPLGMIALVAGLGLFAVIVVFQLVNLPVEFDASRRARVVLAEGGIVSAEEMEPVSRVLNAAALTYVAATVTAILQLIYFLYRAGLLGNRRN
ncbi:MAG: zinc metallopeptidase [Phycisphaerae bacterium]